MEWWQDCVGAALVGTDRRQPDLTKGNRSRGNSPKNGPKDGPKDDGAIAQLIHQLDWSQPESALLSAAGIMAQYQQVGQQVGQIGQQPSTRATASAEKSSSEMAEIEPCLADTLPCCSDRTARHLNAAIETYPEVMLELLSIMAEASQRVPPKWLPKLLAFGKENVQIQTAIVGVLGNRGRWLAAQNLDWQYVFIQGCVHGCVLGLASEAAAEQRPHQQALQQKWQSQWKQSIGSDRITAFQQWRKVAPNEAREALVDSWAQENWRARARLISGLGERLSMADEPFLENALADRAQGVRAIAAELLPQLPESRLCQRMSERVAAFVRLSGKKNTLQIKVSLPEQYDPDWEKDGIVRKSLKGEGERTGWVRQILSKTPLAVWQSVGSVEEGVESASIKPESIAKAAATHEWRDVLVNGWAKAVQNQRASREASQWASAWLNQLGLYDLDKAILADLLLLLPPSERAVFLRSQMPKTANDQNLAHWLQLAAGEGQRWDFEFSQAILSGLITLLKGKPKYGELLSPPVCLALTLHPGMATQATAAISRLTQDHTLTAAWQKFLDRFLGLLNLRWEIYQTFANSS
ncbi:MAG: DUF5691 domain-containing protein [Phormidesmis sp.]